MITVTNIDVDVDVFKTASGDGGAFWDAICAVVVVCGVVEVVRDVVREVEKVETLVGVGVAPLAWDGDGDGDGNGELAGAEDAAGAYGITEGGELLWRRDRGLVYHLAGQR
jgi:hypothetical protein